MSRRILSSVERGSAVSIQVDGQTVSSFEGETVATAMLAAERAGFRIDTRGRPRSLYCNMGTCSECFVTLAGDGDATRRVRACLTPVSDGMRVSTGGNDHE